MKELLLIEWIKSSKKVTTWLFMAMYTLAFTSMFVILRNFKITMDGQEISVAQAVNFDLENTWIFTAFIASYMIWLFVIIVIKQTTDDLRYGIWRQHVIEGLSRSQVVLSKLMFIFVLSLAATLIMSLSTILLMRYIGVSFDFSQINFMLYTTGTYFLYVFGFLSFALVLNLFIKSTGFTLVLMLFWVWIAEPIIRYFEPTELMNYFIANSFNDLIVNPVIKMSDIEGFQLPQDEALIASVVWIAVCIAVSFLKIKKSDL